QLQRAEHSTICPFSSSLWTVRQKPSGAHPSHGSERMGRSIAGSDGTSLVNEPSCAGFGTFSSVSSHRSITRSTWFIVRQRRCNTFPSSVQPSGVMGGKLKPPRRATCFLISFRSSTVLILRGPKSFIESLSSAAVPGPLFEDGWWLG